MLQRHLAWHGQGHSRRTGQTQLTALAALRGNPQEEAVPFEGFTSFCDGFDKARGQSPLGPAYRLLHGTCVPQNIRLCGLVHSGPSRAELANMGAKTLHYMHEYGHQSDILKVRKADPQSATINSHSVF